VVKFATLSDRAVLVSGGRAHDVHTRSRGRFGPDPMAVYRQWPAFWDWAAGQDAIADQGGAAFDAVQLGPPVPAPGQVFAVGLNYRPHAAEAGFQPPADPLVFTKFPSCITGPAGQIPLPAGKVDWELELVVVVGTGGYRIPAEDAWAALAGVTIGQDLSERVVQSRGTPAQFSLGKSFPRFGPIGPWLVTADELPDPDDLELVCELSGQVVQHDRTSNMIFSVPELVARLSAICPLLPGDLIFTGTPGGVGHRQTPPRYLTPQDELISRIAGVGQMRHRFSRTDVGPH
jgi:2-keto-4-pentenoate hydratase/2-oxohepta-3-ene-1,7-dioic acid hydratase in catechol pathway